MYPLNRPEVLIANASERFDEQGNLTDDNTREHIRSLIQSLVTWTRQLQKARA
jgi:chromate reductase, NAD(P)H dehydrogenase (quinone)